MASPLRPTTLRRLSRSWAWAARANVDVLRHYGQFGCKMAANAENGTLTASRPHELGRRKHRTLVLKSGS